MLYSVRFDVLSNVLFHHYVFYNGVYRTAITTIAEQHDFRILIVKIYVGDLNIERNHSVEIALHMQM